MTLPHPPLVTRIAFVLVAALTSNGCTLLGASIGAQSPRCEEHPVTTTATTWMEELRVGEEIGVRRRQRSVFESEESSAPWQTGFYEGIEGDALLLDSAGSTDRIPLADVSLVRVKRGSHWATGALVGALVDAMVVGFIVATTRGNARVDLDPSRVNSAASP